jgi:hypothetical protein
MRLLPDGLMPLSQGFYSRPINSTGCLLLDMDVLHIDFLQSGGRVRSYAPTPAKCPGLHGCFATPRAPAVRAPRSIGAG